MKCLFCGRFMRLVSISTWEIDRYVPDKAWVCSTCDDISAWTEDRLALTGR